ncbi:AAA family ATPase [Nocardioides sp. zg-536]|uniref:AAA family ATPase n=1 Tax=Nocardioides faecalis TaxID=2803858 RepID=A0A939BV78_9ACTN|nr:AAA family ATPase [Nocardioides faecalis]MBM9459641.1 AAA family ATPase [Nocardioides faecalis]QVI58166.1 AAA family ATPase [Nocardioides faecalis]
MTARVIVLAGPSGAGKSRLAERLHRAHGWPTLRLDDFYRDADEPGLPLIAEGPNAGIVDWDDPATWRRDDAVAALRSLCRTGVADLPVYSISESRATGTQHLDLRGATRFCAEGIFAAEVVEQCRREGLLEAAYCITQHPLLTFWRRLARDLREHRKPPLVLVRRGLALARAQRRVVRRATAAGCRVATGEQAFTELGGPEDDHALAG